MSLCLGYSCCTYVDLRAQNSKAIYIYVLGCQIFLQLLELLASQSCFVNLHVGVVAADSNSFNLVCDSEEDTIIELVAAAVVIDFHVQ